MRELPLVARHVARGASFETVCDWRVPSRYASALVEYRAARAAAGLSDLSHQGRLAIRGPERREFLDRLLSNDIRRMAPGDAMPACLLTAVGTVVADLTVYDRGHDLLCVLRPEGTAPFLASVQAHLPEGHGSVECVPCSGVMLFATGPRHEHVLRSVLGAPRTNGRAGCVCVEWNGHPVWLLAYPAHQGVDRLLEVPLAVAEELFDALLEAGDALGLRLIGREAQEILRIEAGRPLLGIDVDCSHDPAEVNLQETVSPTKTRYRGWEHVAARRSRGGLVRKLVGVRSTRPIRPGTVLRDDWRPLGRITSATWSPCLQAPLGLCIVPAGASSEAVRVCGPDGEAPATLLEVPVTE